MQTKPTPNRRTFLGASLATASLAGLHGSEAAAGETAGPKNKICAFIKFVQSLPYDELAARIAEMGFDGIEATVRHNGHVLPERVEEDLPKLVDALKKQDLEITVMASDVNRVDSLSERVLKTAAGLGVPRYRMKNFVYDLNQPVLPQIEAVRPTLKELVALNRQLGISAVYQNHSGARNVGATLWDLQMLLRDYSANELGVAFDIRHATVEGGLSWPTYFNLMNRHLATVYVKDFRWQRRRPENVPLGKGQVNPDFFKQLRASQFDGPISLHVEYLRDAGTEPNLIALRDDLATLRSLLSA